MRVLAYVWPFDQQVASLHFLVDVILEKRPLWSSAQQPLDSIPNTKEIKHWICHGRRLTFDIWPKNEFSQLFDAKLWVVFLSTWEMARFPKRNCNFSILGLLGWGLGWWQRDRDTNFKSIYHNLKKISMTKEAEALHCCWTEMESNHGSLENLNWKYSQWLPFCTWPNQWNVWANVLI